jgi:gliding motility-associated-like protein
MTHTGLFQRPDTSVVVWNWNFPNGNTGIIQNPLQQIYTIAGNFVVTTIATNSSGCKDTATKNITVYPLPVATLPGTLTMAAGFPVMIPATYSSNVASYLWSPAATLSCSNCPQPIANPKFNTTYQVLFTDSNGCRNTGSVTVIVICKNANVFMPNTFSPNNDGSNDIFYPRGQGINRVKTLRVFNRWGEIVFESKDFPVNDPNYGWSGMYKNNKAQPGVYVYQVEFYCDNGDIIRLEGNISLIL